MGPFHSLEKMYRRYQPRRPLYQRSTQRRGLSRRETDDQIHRARIDNLIMNETSFFGNSGISPYVLRSTAVYTGRMQFFPQDYFQGTNLNSQFYPYGFMQFILKPSDTELFKSLRIMTWDRFRISKIKLEYIPTGTESLVSQVIATNEPNTVFNNPPYSNMPMIFSYDPTANVANLEQALAGQQRFNLTNLEGRILLATEARSAMSNNQIKPGSSTTEFKSTVFKPRSQVFSQTGPISTVSNAVIDVRTQYNSVRNPIENDGKVIATYGAFNVIIPRINTEQNVSPNIDINVIATFVFELYGQN